ncbi:MAG: type II toxin-antitoxin system Phd/YefM family antitoxin [Thermomicrobiales bacterium]
MTNAISTGEARTDFERLVDSVGDTEEPAIVEREGRTPVVVISLTEDERLPREEATRDWASIAEVRAQNADKDPEHVFADVTAEVEAVRRERREAHAGGA